MTRNLDEITADLRKLATGPSSGEAALRGLADQLGRPEFVGVDLTSAYVPAVMLPEDSPALRRLAGFLELSRDVLIFVPVIYTWLKIAAALVAYSSYPGNAPFLLAWQQGFGNRTEPLSSSAGVVANVVIAVVALTVVAHWVRGHYDRRVQARQQRLALLLAEATVALTQAAGRETAGVSHGDLKAIGKAIALSSAKLQEALAKSSGDIVSAVNANPGSKLHDMFEQWTAAAKELSSLGTRLSDTQETIKQLRETELALTTLAGQVGEETRKLIGALEEERSLSRHEAHAHHQMATEVSNSTKLLGESLTGLNDRSDQFQELVLRLAHVVDRLDGNGHGGY